MIIGIVTVVVVGLLFVLRYLYLHLLSTRQLLELYQHVSRVNDNKASLLIYYIQQLSGDDNRFINFNISKQKLCDIINNSDQQLATVLFVGEGEKDSDMVPISIFPTR